MATSDSTSANNSLGATAGSGMDDTGTDTTVEGIAHATPESGAGATDSGVARAERSSTRARPIRYPYTTRPDRDRR